MEKNKIQKNDFIEIEFTGKDPDNQIFDTTNPEEAKQIGIQNPEQIKSMIISAGNQMLLKGLDEAILDKELNKEYKIHLESEQAFGKRNPQLMKTYPLSAFKKREINPYPGLVLQLDNNIAKVISVSGGRVMIDFNNPLAGKEVDYTFKITKKITNDNEKINALQDFFFKQRFDFNIKEDEKTKSKKIVFKDEKIKPLVEMMAQKFKEITGMDFEVEEKKEELKNKENKQENKNKEAKEESKKIEDKKENSKKEKEEGKQETITTKQ